jgi:hypothetical protein
MAGISNNRGRKRQGLFVDDDEMEIMPIGAGNEVGRSCIVLKFKGKTLMVLWLWIQRIFSNIHSLTVEFTQVTLGKLPYLSLTK